ncbi:MAG: hypothetical protein ACI8UO_003128 [Verrucomicrobiales bacterium]|jgi:hypothetical protein
MKISTLTFALALLLIPFATFVSAELPAAADDVFSIAVIPDTQHYKGEPLANKVFDGYTDWIADNLVRQRIVFVSHVGDIVDVSNREQWTLARRAMDKFHGRVPYGISVGNHDMTGAGDSSLFQEFFPKSRFEEFDWYAGCFENASGDSAISGNNANSVQLFEAGGMKFVFLHLECNAPDNVLAWADSILTQHADRRALVTTHMGLGPRDKPKTADDYFDAPKGRMTWKKRHGDRGNSPQQMWDKCFKKHANLFMICCGDQSRTQALRQESKGVGGNIAHELLSDYGASGLRLMQFIPAENRIDVRTWNPLTSELCKSTKVVPDRAQHQFSLEYNMSAP